MDTVTPAAGQAPASDDRASQHLRNLVDEAEALLKTAARAGDAKFDATRERLREDIRHLRERLVDLEARASERVKAAAHRTDEAVHAHPYAAMGISALAGLLLGMLLARR